MVLPQGPCAQARERAEPATDSDCDIGPVPAGPHRMGWARWLKHVFDIDMERCPNGIAVELKIIAAVLERPVIEKILTHLGLDPQPPPRGRVLETVQDGAA